MSEQYKEYLLKFGDYSTFEEFFNVYVYSQIKIASVAKINSCENTILLPEGMTKQILISLENNILGEIKKENPKFYWESTITPYNEFQDVYYLCLCNIFY